MQRKTGKLLAIALSTGLTIGAGSMLISTQLRAEPQRMADEKNPKDGFHSALRNAREAEDNLINGAHGDKPTGHRAEAIRILEDAIKEIQAGLDAKD